MFAGTGVENACAVAEDDNEFKAAVKALYHQPFTKEGVAQRQVLLHRYYNNRVSAVQLIHRIWNGESSRVSL